MCATALAAGCGGAEGLAGGQLFVVDAGGGDPRQLTHGAAAVTSLSWSPDGSRLAVVASTPAGAEIDVVDRRGGASRVLVRRRANVWVDSVAWSPAGAAVAFAAFREGGAPLPRFSVETVAVDGSGGRVLARYASARLVPVGPTWAPDGSTLAYAHQRRVFRISVVPARGGTLRAVTGRDADAYDPVWSPDGRWILAVRDDAFVAASPHGARARTVAGGVRGPSSGAWSPSGRRIAVAGWLTDARSHLYLVTFGRPGTVRRLAAEAAPVRPAWSPRGDAVAFADYDGRVLVARLDGTVSTLADLPTAEIAEIAWSPDGRWIAFVARARPPEG